ncbi:MAG: NAD(P)H-hydrate epimerase [Planctomycetota bacterium]
MSITLTRAQVREVDRRAIEEYGIPGIVLMENAGRGAAEIIQGRVPKGGSVAIVCGRGNNGGDGFVIARHLVNDGVTVHLLLTCESAQLSGDAATNYGIAERMRIPVLRSDWVDTLQSADVVVDALLGTGFCGNVRPPLDAVIAAINAARGRIIAIDVPSGLDCDTGKPCNATVRAAETITFVARKTGFDAPGATAFTGAVHVFGIGAPREIVESIQRESA